MADPIDDVSQDGTPLYFTQEDLEARLSAAVCRRILDDNNDGETDFAPLQLLRKDACSRLTSALIGVYPFPLPTPIANEVKRVALDIAVAYAAQRHPEVVKKDWVALLKAADADIEKIHEGKRRLDASKAPALEPTNRTARVTSQNPDDNGAAPTKFFSGGSGDF